MAAVLEIYFTLDSDSVGDYISCGASSVVLSDAIFNKEAMAQKSFHAIYELACLAALQGKEAVIRWVLV